LLDTGFVFEVRLEERLSQLELGFRWMEFKEEILRFRAKLELPICIGLVNWPRLRAPRKATWPAYSKNLSVVRNLGIVLVIVATTVSVVLKKPSILSSQTNSKIELSGTQIADGVDNNNINSH
jgi:hypothetical protein